MPGPAVVTPWFEFGAFRTAVGATFVFAALSILVSALIAPTATLTALGLASWVSMVARRGRRPNARLGLQSIAALAVLGGAAVGFVEAPHFLSPLRGVMLAGGLLPLALVERARSGRRMPAFSG